jgi:hypothetical protein
MGGKLAGICFIKVVAGGFFATDTLIGFFQRQ